MLPNLRQGEVKYKDDGDVANMQHGIYEVTSYADVLEIGLQNTQRPG